MASYVDASEVRELAAQLTAAPATVRARAPMVASKTGFATVADAQVGAPVDTGTLASSISVDFDGDGMGFVAGPTVEYGGYVEDGTSGPYVIPNAFGRGDFVMHPGISPQPYMGPAFDGQVGNAEDALGQIGYQALS